MAFFILIWSLLNQVKGQHGGKLYCFGVTAYYCLLLLVLVFVCNTSVCSPARLLEETKGNRTETLIYCCFIVDYFIV